MTFFYAIDKYSAFSFDLANLSKDDNAPIDQNYSCITFCKHKIILGRYPDLCNSHTVISSKTQPIQTEKE
ncbi:hypothetical protein GCM10022246_11230 [Pedobacter ginsengiterrae]|uniref:Uncharacterized protein n=1 Tax=Pedobacter ginsengiterrae TaxID=871696 RepID=A0ABP7P6U2_9SPHI